MATCTYLLELTQSDEMLVEIGGLVTNVAWLQRQQCEQLKCVSENIENWSDTAYFDSLSRASWAWMDLQTEIYRRW